MNFASYLHSEFFPALVLNHSGVLVENCSMEKNFQKERGKGALVGSVTHQEWNLN